MYFTTFSIIHLIIISSSIGLIISSTIIIIVVLVVVSILEDHKYISLDSTPYAIKTLCKMYFWKNTTGFLAIRTRFSPVS